MMGVNYSGGMGGDASCMGEDASCIGGDAYCTKVQTCVVFVPNANVISLSLRSSSNLTLPLL